MTAIMLVQSGVALAAVPKLATQGLKAIRLIGPQISRTIGLVRRRGETDSDLAMVFQTALKARAAKPSV